jgi:hypothetical protein
MIPLPAAMRRAQMPLRGGTQMLEQFRILSAALRLREFTTSQLAHESAVSEATVQKTLRRRIDLFSKVEGQKNARAQMHRVRTEAVKVALQGTANSFNLPDVSDNLGLGLTEDTLIRVLPRAKVSERRELIAAASDQLALAHNAPDTLRVLYRCLKIVVTTYDWLARCSSQLGKAPAYHAVPDSRGSPEH